MGFCDRSMFCSALLCVHSSFAIISMGKRELVALLCFFFLVSHDCCVALPHDTCTTGLAVVCDCGIPDHTHLLFFMYNSMESSLVFSKIVLGSLFF